MPSASCAGRSEIENSTASLVGAVRIVLPGRHHEHVARTPFEHFAVDRWSALAFEADEDGAVGRAVVLALEALRQQRQMRAHGRRRPAAVERIGVAHAEAVMLVDVAGLLHAVEDRPHALIGVVDDRRADHRGVGAVRQHAGAETPERIVVGARGVLHRRSSRCSENAVSKKLTVGTSSTSSQIIGFLDSLP